MTNSSALPSVPVEASAFPNVDLPRASDAVMRALIDGIRAGAAPPGSRLPRDQELARRFGVSRPVVREAIDLLRRAGIVGIRGLWSVDVLVQTPQSFTLITSIT